MIQNFTSAATAVNGKAGKLPAIYKKINLNGLFILDIGCGAEIKHIRDYVTDRGGYWFGIDPFNQTATSGVCMENWTHLGSMLLFSTHEEH